MSLTFDTYTITGSKKATMIVPEAVFARPVDPALLAQAIRVYTTNQRQGTKNVKTRGQVSYSTRKLWRQKGTGRARHGSRKAPIFVGGGVAHGPTGKENYRLHLTKKMRQQALFGALTLKNQTKMIKVLESTDNFPEKTGSALKLFNKLFPTPKAKILVVLDQPNPTVLRSLKNLPSVTPTQASRLNVYEILAHTQLLFTKAAIDLIAARVIQSPPKTKPTPKKPPIRSNSRSAKQPTL